MKLITDLGTIGTTGGITRPIDFTLQRNGVAWNLTGYTSPTLAVRDLRTGAAVTPGASPTIEDAVNGVVRYAPTASDALYANSGVFEGRIWVTPGGGGDPEPSSPFRFRIDDGPNP